MPVMDSYGDRLVRRAIVASVVAFVLGLAGLVLGVGGLVGWW
jgi:Ca2+/H+ antiporter